MVVLVLWVVVVVVVVAALAWFAWRVPLQIDIGPDDLVFTTALRRRTVVPAGSVRAFETHGTSPVLVHDGGEVRFGNLAPVAKLVDHVESTMPDVPVHVPDWARRQRGIPFTR